MPNWEEINRRLREEEKSPSEEVLSGDVTPSEESWSEKCDRLQREREAEEKARRNEPGMLKIGFKFTFDKIAGWFKKLKTKK